MPETTTSSPFQLTKTLKNFCFQTLLAKDFTKDKLSKLIVNKLDYKKSSLSNNSREDLMNIISNQLDQFCVHDLLNCCNSIVCLSAIALYRFQFLTNFDGSKELKMVDLNENEKEKVENESENGSDEMNQLISGLQIGGEQEKIIDSNNENEEDQQKPQEENQIINLKSLSPPKFYINKNRDQTDIQQEFKEFIQKTYLPWFEQIPVTSNTDNLKFNYLSQCFNNFQNQTKVQQIIDANTKKSKNFEACVDKICQIFPVSRPVSVNTNCKNGSTVDNNGWIKFEQSRPSETESKMTLESTPIKIKSPKLSVVIRSKKGDDSDRTSNSNSSSDKKSVNNDEIDKENIQPENLSPKEPLCPKFSSHQRNNRIFMKDNKGSLDSFKTSDSKSVYVSNLEYSVSKDMLINYFEKHKHLFFPLITRTTLQRDRNTGKSKGFAYIEFENEALAKKAIEKFDGCVIQNRTINVALKRPTHGFHNSGKNGFGDFNKNNRRTSSHHYRNASNANNILQPNQSLNHSLNLSFSNNNNHNQHQMNNSMTGFNTSMNCSWLNNSCADTTFMSFNPNQSYSAGGGEAYFSPNVSGMFGNPMVHNNTNNQNANTQNLNQQDRSQTRSTTSHSVATGYTPNSGRKSSPKSRNSPKSQTAVISPQQLSKQASRVNSSPLSSQNSINHVHQNSNSMVINQQGSPKNQQSLSNNINVNNMNVNSMDQAAQAIAFLGQLQRQQQQNNVFNQYGQSLLNGNLRLPNNAASQNFNQLNFNQQNFSGSLTFHNLNAWNTNPNQGSSTFGQTAFANSTNNLVSVAREFNGSGFRSSNTGKKVFINPNFKKN